MNPRKRFIRQAKWLVATNMVVAYVMWLWLVLVLAGGLS